MQKTKLFVTASAVCFALAGAAFSGHQSESSSSSAILYVAGLTTTSSCVQASATQESNCSILNSGGSCTVIVTDAWGNPTVAAAYASPLLNNLCLLALRLPG